MSEKGRCSIVCAINNFVIVCPAALYRSRYFASLSGKRKGAPRKAQKCLMQAPRLVCLPPTNWSQCQPYSDAIVDTHPIWLKMEQEAQFPALAWSPPLQSMQQMEHREGCKWCSTIEGWVSLSCWWVFIGKAKWFGKIPAMSQVTIWKNNCRTIVGHIWGWWKTLQNQKNYLGAKKNLSK